MTIIIGIATLITLKYLFNPKIERMPETDELILWFNWQGSRTYFKIPWFPKRK